MRGLEDTGFSPHHDRKRVSCLPRGRDHRKARRGQGAEKWKARMRFLVDGMLGGLARWLRILGQEVRYDSNVMDNDLLRIAHEESMILLTRDEELYRRAIARKITSALVLGETEEERLAQMASTFGVVLDADMAETKCPECGSDLKETPKNDLVDEVPLASL